MEKRDWLLLIIGSEIQPIQVQKALFKLAKEAGVPPAEAYEFTPYNWGPCSFEIYDDLQALREEGLIEAVPTARGWSVYRTTKEGCRLASALRGNADLAMLQRVDTLREWVTTRPFEQLLKDVYRDYPEYATQSMFVER
ncbi:MAG: hypothetical protein HY680_07105 [Chloroflexi bacterium]|nr:hypothetical protein [Chloroflexota bacterium]